MAQGRVQRMQCWVVAACVVASVSTTASAFVFKAGGTGEWRVPDQQANANVSAYNQWAEHTRFRVGDAVAFSYQPGNDSVLLVDKSSYDACNTNTPIDTFADGNTVFTFTRSGPYYFISGNKDNCNRNEKLIVVVMGERAANGTAPAPALAPSAGTTSPNSPPSPPPPPSGIEISPTPEQSINAAARPRAAGIAGAAGLAIGTLFYALV
uniref:Phytocyanin domain-containing protein n=1 Tax=Oryza meridionalis TaxID=40149 RepID=A0A0E0C8P4_9ORYZ